MNCRIKKREETVLLLFRADSKPLSFRELRASKTNRKTQRFGGEMGREETRDGRGKREANGFALLFLASGDIDGAALTSWARGTVAVRPFISPLPRVNSLVLFSFYWWLVIYATLFIQSAVSRTGKA